MDSEGIGDRNSSGILDCPSSGMATTSIPYNSVEGLPICSGTMSGIDPFQCPGWDHIISGSQVGKFGDLVLGSEFVHSHYPSGMVENKAASSHLVHFPPDSGLADLLPKIPCFGSSFRQMNEPGCPSNFPPNQGIGNDVDCQEKYEENSGGVMGTSPNGKRKRKNVEEKQKDPIGNTGGVLNEDDEKKNIGSNSRGRQGVRQQNKEKEKDKDNSTGAEPCKETYIHMRAKRGQATNSHSLAERVRRERISERMRMLQELVPGCSKITGKAVMLDEIINYVQSLQQQVEFLSMKLATVNPELNVDIQQILSKDINLLHSRIHNNGPPGLSLSHPFPDLPQGIVNGFPSSTAPPFQAHALPQNLWNSELQSVLQMGFENLGPNGE